MERPSKGISHKPTSRRLLQLFIAFFLFYVSLYIAIYTDSFFHSGVIYKHYSPVAHILGSLLSTAYLYPWIVIPLLLSSRLSESHYASFLISAAGYSLKTIVSAQAADNSALTKRIFGIDIFNSGEITVAGILYFSLIGLAVATISSWIWSTPTSRACRADRAQRNPPQ